MVAQARAVKALLGSEVCELALSSVKTEPSYVSVSIRACLLRFVAVYVRLLIIHMFRSIHPRKHTHRIHIA